ncbi:MAG: tRNA pseudouridine(55) synthase TruB [Clostridia bacterium]|nr:tRNA pseudouridine(55) synthase TruB [Clostridia bacterium]
MNGVLIINKPMDFTSFDAVAVTRKVSGQRKLGHCGTLDPNATGVLPVLLGGATKAQDILPNHDKEYVAELKFGTKTDTLDIWGKVLSEEKSSVTKEQFEAVLPNFRGEIMQVPPMYSALKQQGQRLYDLARQGIEVKREARPVTVYSLTSEGFYQENQTAKIRVKCSKGTYIRSLIDDIGNALGTVAVMTALCRTSACGFNLEQSITIDGLKTLTPDEIKERLLPIETLFESYLQVNVSEAQSVRFKNGGALSLERLRNLPKNYSENEIFRVKYEDKFLGLGVIKEKELKIFKLFQT